MTDKYPLYRKLHRNYNPGFGFLTLLFLSVWSDDDWLKKFSGKTTEEAEAEAAGGETTNTATQEVRWLFSKVLWYLFDF